MDILLGSTQSAIDRRNFFKAQLVFWLLAATDGHAKNFSIAHHPGGNFSATPIYDVLSAHPIIGNGANQLPRQKIKLAMAIRGQENHYLLDKIQPRHWLALAEQCGLGARLAQQLIAEVVQATPVAIEHASRQLPADYPMDVADAIFSGMRGQCEKLTKTGADPVFHL